MVLLNKRQYYVIQAAILGSILATMLLCLGLCFFAAGTRRKHSTFDSAVSEVGSGLLLIAYGPILCTPRFLIGTNNAIVAWDLRFPLFITGPLLAANSQRKCS